MLCGSNFGHYVFNETLVCGFEFPRPFKMSLNCFFDAFEIIIT